MTLPPFFSIGATCYMAWVAILHWRQRKLYATPRTLRLDLRGFRAGGGVLVVPPKRSGDILGSLVAWFSFRRVCAWCHRRTGGNPLARHDTHGICPKCSHKMITENYL